VRQRPFLMSKSDQTDDSRFLHVDSKGPRDEQQDAGICLSAPDSNGVFVSGKRVEKTPLENGDIIELGEVRLRFTLNQSDE
jgi:pSer/pThr/pTyr-binding forkhead associated (FHA) protein